MVEAALAFAPWVKGNRDDEVYVLNADGWVEPSLAQEIAQRLGKHARVFVLEIPDRLAKRAAVESVRSQAVEAGWRSKAPLAR